MTLLDWAPIVITLIGLIGSGIGWLTLGGRRRADEASVLTGSALNLVEQLQEEIKELRDRLDRMRDALDIQRTTVADLRDKVAELERENRALKSENLRLRNALNKFMRDHGGDTGLPGTIGNE